MLGYVKHCWSAYLGGLLELRSRYVRDVVLEARRLQRDEDLVWRGTKALVELSSERGTDQWITIKEIRQRSGITPKQSATSGLWPWLRSGAEVIRKKEGTRACCIHSDFRQAMELVFRPSAISPTREITELQGLGKEIWEGIDPQEYVERERQSWSGYMTYKAKSLA